VSTIGAAIGAIDAAFRVGVAPFEASEEQATAPVHTRSKPTETEKDFIAMRQRTRQIGVAEVEIC
jgi:hypothetical protein